MFEFVPYKEEHVLEMLNQESNKNIRQAFNSGLAKVLETNESVTGMLNGKPVLCGGIMKVWDNRGHIWCVFDESSRTNFVPIFRGIKKFLNSSSFTRIEVSIPFFMDHAMRRAELLGFYKECSLARKYLPDGTDCAIYVRIKGDK